MADTPISLIGYKDTYKVNTPAGTRAIPFAVSGGPDPALVRFSTEPIPADFELTEATASAAAFPGGADVWNNTLLPADFNCDDRRVAGAELPHFADSSSPFAPWRAAWPGFAVARKTVGGNADGLAVSNYSVAAQVAAGTRVLPPWRWSWERIVVAPGADGDAVVDHPTQLDSLRAGVPALEPTDRMWTNGISVAVHLEDPYSHGVYELLVAPTTGAGGGDNEPEYGIYAIANPDADDTARIWRHTDGGYAIMWSDSRGRWEIRRLGATDGGADAADAVVQSQYLEPYAEGTSWLFGMVNRASKTMFFPYFSGIIGERSGPTKAGDWGNGVFAGTDADGYTLRGSVYTTMAESYGGSVVGAWESNVVVAADGTGLRVSGYSDSRVNGLYSLFHNGAEQEKIWLKESGGAYAYTISWDLEKSIWRLCTSADGIYAHRSGTDVTIDAGGNVPNVDKTRVILFGNGKYAFNGEWLGDGTGNGHLYYGATAASLYDRTGTDGLRDFVANAGEYNCRTNGVDYIIKYNEDNSRWEYRYKTGIFATAQSSAEDRYLAFSNGLYAIRGDVCGNPASNYYYGARDSTVTSADGLVEFAYSSYYGGWHGQLDGKDCLIENTNGWQIRYLDTLIDTGNEDASVDRPFAISFSNGLYALSHGKVFPGRRNSSIYYGATTAGATGTGGLAEFTLDNGIYRGQLDGLNCTIAYDSGTETWTLCYQSAEPVDYWEREFSPTERNILLYDSIAGKCRLYNCTMRSGISLDLKGLSTNGSWLEGEKDGPFFYDPAGLCWRYTSGTFSSAQMLTPQLWRDSAGVVRDTKVAWTSNPTVTEPSAAWAGTYLPMGFFAMLIPPHFQKATKKHVLHFTPQDGRWHISRRLMVNGNYALDDSATGITARQWTRTAGGDTFRLQWDSANAAWMLVLAGEADSVLDTAEAGDDEDCTPAECSWPDYAVYDGAEAALVLAGADAAAGTYALADATAAGNARVWRRELPAGAGAYQFEYNAGRESWVLALYATAPNGDYAPSGTGSARIWTKGNCSIGWDAATGMWVLRMDDNGTIRDLASVDGVIPPAAMEWGDIAIAPLDAENPWGGLQIAAPGDELTGEYTPRPQTEPGAAREWEFAAGCYSATLSFDADALCWRLAGVESGINGDYALLLPDAAGTARIWSHQTNPYAIAWNASAGRWEIQRADATMLYCQSTPADNPEDGAWQDAAGTAVPTPVAAPLAGARIFHAECPFIPPGMETYKYVVRGLPNYDYLNGEYFLVDPAAADGDRVWRHDAGSGIYSYIYWDPNAREWGIYDAAPGAPGNRRAYSGSGAANAAVADLSQLSWWHTAGYYAEAFRGLSRVLYALETTRRYYMVAGDGSGAISNMLIFDMVLQEGGVTGITLLLAGASGSPDYTGFAAADGRHYPTSLVGIQYSAQSAGEVRVRFAGGITVPGTGFDVPGESRLHAEGTAMLAPGRLGESDTPFVITMYARDDAGATAEATASIVRISRLWRLAGANIKHDSAGYSTKVYAYDGANKIPIAARTTADDEFSRQWEDIFYPETHGYPRLADGTIDYDKAFRISQGAVDTAGATGPTPQELQEYDQLALNGDGSALATDADGRYQTAGWQPTKVYNRMESSAANSMRVWIIDNTGYADFSLEFEWFDLSDAAGSIPPNPLAPHAGDTLVFYDASAAGCAAYNAGTKKWELINSALLRELFAVGGSYRAGSKIKLKYSAIGDDIITITGNGFITANISATSRLCMILYTDGTEQASGFKLKAGPRHNLSFSNYDLEHARGELWIHQPPGGDSARWHSPAAVVTDHQYYTSETTVFPMEGKVSLDARSGRTILANCACYTGIGTGEGDMEPPRSWFAYDGTHPLLSKYLLYHDDCVDFYDVLVGVSLSTNASEAFSGIYSFTDATAPTGRIASNIAVNKDKGTVTISATPPSGRLFASYTYHTFLRLTSDGYGDLHFYDSTLVPASDEAVAGMVDWTHVDLMIVNEGTNALTNGVLKFLARGYVSGTGSAATVTEVVDQNRPWDIQSGTLAETVERTGGEFSVAFDGLTPASRQQAITVIDRSASGVSLGTIPARGRGFLRVYWSLATSVSSGGNATYVATTRGAKLWSSELSGNYFVVTT